MPEVSEAAARARRIPAYTLLRAVVAQDADAAVLLVDQARKAPVSRLIPGDVQDWQRRHQRQAGQAPAAILRRQSASGWALRWG